MGILSEVNFMDQEIYFESLAAKKKLEEESQIYITALEQALIEKGNKNIAITGGYGAGKTTIIDAYFEEHKSEAEKMIKISIATFQTNQDEPKNLVSNENILEQQILQQMFYQVNPNNIPNSKFTKISDLSFWYVFRIIIFLLTIIILTFSTIRNNWLNYSVFTDNVGTNVSDKLLYLAIIVFSVLFNGLTIYLLLMIFRKLGVSKFGVGNTNIEFNFKDGSTVFNHYLDEIIYLFKRTKYRYVVLEDLDRFGNIKIFERLRSLNTTLNSASKLKDLDIKFIYALKDNIFTQEDETDLVYNRTKFFDFIIPTIKVLHKSNAESYLLKKLENFLPENEDKSLDIHQKLSKKLVEDISLFINDMRTLINICNEFEVYRLRLKSSSVTYNNLLAFVVYKNIYPKDYSDLLENKGIVYSVFNKTEEIILKLNKEIEDLKKIPTDEIGSIITAKEDIAMLFAKKRNLLNRIIKQGADIVLNLSSNDYSVVGVRVLNHILNQGINGEFGVYQYNYQNNIESRYLNIEEFVTIDSVNYLNLYNDFEKKQVKKEQEINSQISNLQKTIKSVRTKSISRLIKEDKIELHVDLSDKGLINFLIRYNWLNESYEDYLTVFCEGALSERENKFIRLIKLGSNENNFNVPLFNTKKIVEKIRVDDINSRVIINLDLIQYLLENQTEENEEKIQKIIQTIYYDIPLYFEELVELLEGLEGVQSSSKHLVSKLFEKSIQNNIDIWEVVSEEELPFERLLDYVMIILKNGNPDDLIKLESVINLRDFISCKLEVERLITSNNLFDVLERLEVRFNSLSGVKENIIEKLIEINAYRINYENLKRIFDSKNISLELIETDQQVNQYCMSNVDVLITEVLLKQNNYNEKDKLLLDFIESIIEDIETDISDSTIEALIINWIGTVNNLSDTVSHKLVKILYQLKKFALRWSNIDYCKSVFEKDEENFDLNYLLSEDGYWLDLIEKSSNPVQEIFVNNGKYDDFVNEIIQLSSSEHPKMREFIEHLLYPVSVKEPNIVDRDIINLLIDNQRLSWNVAIYKEIDSSNHKKRFVVDNIIEAEDNLPELIEDNHLFWSMELFLKLIESENLDLNLLRTYIKNRVMEIEITDFISILDRELLDFDKEMLNKLLDDSSKTNVLIEYLLYLSSKGFEDRVIDVISEYRIPWDISLFKKVNDFNVASASIYLLDNSEEIERIQMDQDLFENLIINSQDIKMNLCIINRYFRAFEINSVVSNKVYEHLIEDSEIILETLDNTVIIKMIHSLTIEKKAKFLFKFFNFNHFERDDIFVILSELNKPFDEIKKNGKGFNIDHKHANIEELLRYLKDESIQVIYGFDENNQGYLVRNKRK
jgi:hypothetical protein